MKTSMKEGKCIVCVCVKYCLGDEIKEDEIDGSCSRHGGDESCMQHFDGIN
jgi:hypothetical protein